MIDADATVIRDGKEIRIKDLPDRQDRIDCGLGHHPYLIARHKVHPGFKHRPIECPHADELTGVWINDGNNLVCPGCGLDGT